MSTVPIKVNAVRVKKEGERFIVTLGNANGTTSQWDLAINMGTLLVVEIEKSLAMESAFE